MFRRSKQNLPQTNVFLVLELIKKLYTYRAAESKPQRRVRMHDKNVEHLDRENWILIFKKIIEIFEKHECSFNDNKYTDALINLLERYVGTGWDDSLDAQLKTWVGELETFMDDDMNTAKVVANLFEIIPSINSLKDKHIAADAVSGNTWLYVQEQLILFIENIFILDYFYSDF